MGLFRTQWEARYDHDKQRLTITRDEWTKGFAVISDGVVIARRAWSLMGTGYVAGSVLHQGKQTRIAVRVRLASCQVWVDEEPVSVVKIG